MLKTADGEVCYSDSWLMVDEEDEGVRNFSLIMSWRRF